MFPFITEPSVGSGRGGNPLPDRVIGGGSIPAWSGISQAEEDKIYVMRSFVPEGTYDRMQYGLDRILPGPPTVRQVDLAVFDLNETLVASTGFQNVPTTGNPQFVEQTLNTPLVSSGEDYWLAFLSNTKNMDILTSAHQMPDIWWGVFYEVEENYTTAITTFPSGTIETTSLPFLALLNAS